MFLPAASAPYQGIAFASPPAAYTGDGSAAYFIRSDATPNCAGTWDAAIGRLRSMNASARGSIRSSDIPPMAIRGWRRSTRLAFDAGIDQTLREGARARARRPTSIRDLQQVIAFANSLSGTDPFGRFFGYYNSQGGLSRGVETNVAVSPDRGAECVRQLHLCECGGADAHRGRQSANLRDSAASVFGVGHLARR